MWLKDWVLFPTVLQSESCVSSPIFLCMNCLHDMLDTFSKSHSDTHHVIYGDVWILFLSLEFLILITWFAFDFDIAYSLSYVPMNHFMSPPLCFPHYPIISLLLGCRMFL